MPTRPLALEVLNLHKSFGGRQVLRGLSLQVRPGELCVLIGRSGCGKSTLLRCLKQLELPDSGHFRLHGEAGLVFQSYQLFPHWTALENVMSGPRIVKSTPKHLAKDQALGLLKRVGLQDHAGHYPAQLSGGQQQRAAIARSLAMQPSIMLYDEPTASLDPHLSQEVMQVMLELKKDGLTQVLVTHEHAFARKAADQVVFIEEGQVIEAGPPGQVFGRPRDPRTRRFVRGLQ
jgi:ABC-type polar amino acid transport system ATPase subunit